MTISDYIAELELQLRRRRVLRVRLLREVEDHLRDSVEELIAGGMASADAEGEAVRRFGAAADVATRFSAFAAASVARRALNLAALALAAYVVCFLVFSATASAAVRDFPQGAASFFAVQLAGVALLAAFVRSWRWRHVSTPPAELTFITRGVTLAVGALLAAAVAEALAALLRPAGVIVWDAAQWLTLAFAAAALLIVAASLCAVRAGAQAAALARFRPHRRDCHGAAVLLDDLVALSARLPIPSVPRLGAFHPLRHPWRVVGLVGALAFVAVGCAQLTEGSSLRDGSIVVGALALGLLEAGAIVGSFAVFGRFLGLRDAR